MLCLGTHIDQKSKTSVNALCNGVIILGAQIGGLFRILIANNTDGNGCLKNCIHAYFSSSLTPIEAFLGSLIYIVCLDENKMKFLVCNLFVICFQYC